MTMKIKKGATTWGWIYYSADGKPVKRVTGLADEASARLSAVTFLSVSRGGDFDAASFPVE